MPYGAGGVGDLTMRLLAQKLSETAGQQFVIENKPGAGGSLSARGALTAAPDGYSLAMTGNGQAIAMTLFKRKLSARMMRLFFEVWRCYNPASYKAGRNDPCPCGSGKKYKACHLL